ncbi:Pectin lyase-like superfamily protein, partial [Zea mays]
MDPATRPWPSARTPSASPSAWQRSSPASEPIKYIITLRNLSLSHVLSS